ncbi:hypothetical protein SAMN05421759_101219 [Roseivivax lentus]|uniref:Uncharacterized protein n=1 Tax=Roseivivax lentus TaxID=633194 RepID=A0A1N7JU45_9RHOB|nr:hypothetical protein [Roseivivax lentus]SIS52724.1 hypothetical protein SAMN05421759_101219 [Roseivivax lentus]
MAKFLLVAALAAPFILSDTLAASAQGNERWIPITSKNEFLMSVAGKQLEDPRGNTLFLGRNGRYKAVLNGKAAAGTWDWENGVLCRQSADDSNSGCTTWEVAGDWVRLNRVSGNADRVHRYRFK